jgi:hypothetical protein
MDDKELVLAGDEGPVEPLTIQVNGEPMVIEDPAPRLNLFVHQQGIRVDVPDAVEINSRNTIDCMAKMKQNEWEHISTGDLFIHLFNELFRDGTVLIPKTIEELNKGDYGVIHGAGLIVLACEAIFTGKTKLFFRTPEDHLHPKWQRTVMGMLLKLRVLAASMGEEVEVSVEEKKPALPVKKTAKKKPAAKPKKPRKKKGK